MNNRTKLLKIKVTNLGCIGPEGLEVDVDKVLCLVGPNNSGKSTILHAYELFMASVKFQASDRCQRAEHQPTTIELWVHIPDGIQNIGKQWKDEIDDNLVVRCRWVWEEGDLNGRRETWDPQNHEYADDNAAGIHTVFRSRLPVPFRIGALDNPVEEHEKLLTLVLQPIADKLKVQLNDESSAISSALQNFQAEATKPVEEEAEKIEAIGVEISKSHNVVFPELQVDFDIKLGTVNFDPISLLRKNSGLKFSDFGDSTLLGQQGTGSQRAVFWSMLQVRSKLKTENDSKHAIEYQTHQLQAQITKLQKNVAEAKRPDTKAKRQAELDDATNGLAALSSTNIDLPGYMLLIDEPEIALHPNAIRAASQYLYGLGSDDSWQVMMTTHSPIFVDPLSDHTTIVRLVRNRECITPKTYKSDGVTFSANEKENLKMLLRFDNGFAEMFFGQRPILVEGDTEYTAFESVMFNNSSEFPHAARPQIIRARGKDTLVLLIKMLSHFKVDYSVLHDSDTKKESATGGSAWSANKRIFEAIETSRSNGVKAIHRISIPDFEVSMTGAPASRTGNKPWKFLEKFDDAAIQKRVKELLVDLCTGPEKPFDGEFMAELEKKVAELSIE